MENITYARAYTEVLEILKYIDKEEYNRIPKEKIEFYGKNKDKGYIFTINKNLKLEEQPISKKAKAIIVMLYRDYMVDEHEKEKINEILKLNAKKIELLKTQQYSREVDFNDKKLHKYEQITDLVSTEKIRWYKKLFNKIKSLLKIEK